MFESTSKPGPLGEPSTQPKPVAMHETTSFPIHYRTLGLSVKVRVPDLPLRYFLGHGISCEPYTSYLDEHYAWKRVIYPDEPEAKLKRSCLVELDALAFAFPGVNDKGTVLGFAAYFTYLCDVDDFIEAMDIDVAERCVESSVSILEGEAWTPHSNDPNDLYTKVQKYCAHYRDHLVKLLRPSAAAACVREAQNMLLSQLAEQKHNNANLPYEDFEHYLKLRHLPLGLHPMLTFLEHYCLPDEDTEFRYPEIKLLKKQVATAGVTQNDLGGVEKDFANYNRSNIVVALAELQGKRIRTVEDILQQPQILDEAAEEHNKLMAKVMQTWADIHNQERFGDDRVRLMADMALTLSVTHLQWTLETARYTTPGAEDKVEKRY